MNLEINLWLQDAIIEHLRQIGLRRGKEELEHLLTNSPNMWTKEHFNKDCEICSWATWNIDSLYVTYDILDKTGINPIRKGFTISIKQALKSFLEDTET